MFPDHRLCKKSTASLKLDEYIKLIPFSDIYLQKISGKEVFDEKLPRDFCHHLVKTYLLDRPQLH